MDGEEDPPHELVIAWQMEDRNALPVQGALFDQPAGLMRRAKAAYNAWRAISLQRDMSVPLQKLRQMHPELLRLADQIIGMRQAEERSDDGR